MNGGCSDRERLFCSDVIKKPLAYRGLLKAKNVGLPAPLPLPVLAPGANPGFCIGSRCQRVRNNHHHTRLPRRFETCLDCASLSLAPHIRLVCRLVIGLQEVSLSCTLSPAGRRSLATATAVGDSPLSTQEHALSRVALIAECLRFSLSPCRFWGRQDSTTRPLLPAIFITTSLPTVPVGHGIMRWKPPRGRPYPVELYRAASCLRTTRADAPVLPCIPAGLPHHGTSIRARLISLRSIKRSTLASRPPAGFFIPASPGQVRPAIYCRRPFRGRPNSFAISSVLNGVEAGISACSAPLQPHQRNYTHAAIAV